jgi:hypothetical protein
MVTTNLVFNLDDFVVTESEVAQPVAPPAQPEVVAPEQPQPEPEVTPPAQPAPEVTPPAQPAPEPEPDEEAEDDEEDDDEVEVVSDPFIDYIISIFDDKRIWRLASMAVQLLSAFIIAGAIGDFSSMGRSVRSSR